MGNLQVHPELRRGAEAAGEQQGSFRRDGTLPVQDAGDLFLYDINIPRQSYDRTLLQQTVPVLVHRGEQPGRLCQPSFLTAVKAPAAPRCFGASDDGSPAHRT